MTEDSTLGWLLLTNDDGIEAIGMKKLVQKLNSRGHKVVVLHPKIIIQPLVCELI